MSSFFGKLFAFHGVPSLMDQHGDLTPLTYRVRAPDGTVLQQNDFCCIIGELSIEEVFAENHGLIKLERRSLEVPVDQAGAFGGVADAQLMGVIELDGEDWQIDPVEGRAIAAQTENFATINIKRTHVRRSAADGILREAR